MFQEGEKQWVHVVCAVFSHDTAFDANGKLYYLENGRIPFPL